MKDLNHGGTWRALNVNNLKWDLKTLREASHLSQECLAKKVGVCVAQCRNLERAGDPRVLTAILQLMHDCEDERTITLREAYQWLLKH